MVNKLESTEQFLESLNAIAAQINPLIGIVGVGVRAIFAMAKANGTNIAPFEQELAKYQAQLDAANAAVAEFRAKYGSDAPEAPSNG